jgi:Reverse transcriptase (RNA-dependent DNA polymerase)
MQNPLLAYKTSSDPNTMYMHKATKQPDRQQFHDAMAKEVNDQMKNGNFTVIPRSQVPKGKLILPAVWQMKRKRDIKTQEVKKWKARLNFDGARMRHGEHYDETYSPVTSWTSVRLLLALAACHDWYTVQLDYVLAFPQAPVEREIYMEQPKGYDMDPSRPHKDYFLKLHQNVYSQKQAGRVWNKYLVNKLVHEVGFKQSKVDECVFYHGNVLYVLYTDDSLLAGPSKKEIDQAMEDIKAANFKIEIEGDIKDFLGVNIEQSDDGSITFTQPHLIDKVLNATGIHDVSKIKDTPAAISPIIHQHSSSVPFDNLFNYHLVLGMLNYLDKAT